MLYKANSSGAPGAGAEGKLCPGDTQRILGFIERFGARRKKMGKAYIEKALGLALGGVIGIRQVNDASLMLYAKANGLHLISYNYRGFDRLS